MKLSESPYELLMRYVLKMRFFDHITILFFNLVTDWKLYHNNLSN